MSRDKIIRSSLTLKRRLIKQTDNVYFTGIFVTAMAGENTSGNKVHQSQ
jgi:hypothetical protein